MVAFPPIVLSFICLRKAWTSNLFFTLHSAFAIFVLVQLFRYVSSHKNLSLFFKPRVYERSKFPLVLYLSHTFGIIYASYWSDSILLGVSFAVNLTVISHHYNTFSNKDTEC